MFQNALVCVQLLSGVRASDFGDLIWDVSCGVIGEKIPIAGEIICDQYRKLIEIDPDKAEPVDISVIPHGKCEKVQLKLDSIAEVSHTWWYGCYNFVNPDGTGVECCQFKYGSNGLDKNAGKFPHVFCNDEQEDGMINPNVAGQYGVGWIKDPQYYFHQTNMAIACGANLDHVDVQRKYSQECNLHKDNFKTTVETKNNNNAHRFLKFNDGSCEIWPEEGDRKIEKHCSF